MPSATGVLITVGLWALAGTAYWAMFVALGLRFDDATHGPILNSKRRLPVWNLEGSTSWRLPYASAGIACSARYPSSNLSTSWSETDW